MNSLNKLLTFVVIMNIIELDWSKLPERLHNVASPPKQLFLWGNQDCLVKPCLAIVGSRRATLETLKKTKQWASALSKAGIVVISGLARGIDGAAHLGALEGEAKTIAVLGCGLDIDYPKEHHELKKAIIAQGGLIISEYPLGTPPHPRHFPHRNRIISGLSDGVLVMEAALKSGSLVTARLAAEQGREVMAVPGNIDHPLKQGCHWLIRQGASLVSSLEDIVECLKINLSPLKESSETEPLLAYVGAETITLDELLATSGLAFSEVCSILVQLEATGKIERVAGGYKKKA